MATFFFFNSKKEEGKKMPPRKLMPQAVSCVPHHLRGQKNSRKRPRSNTFCPNPPMPAVLGINTWGLKSKQNPTPKPK